MTAATERTEQTAPQGTPTDWSYATPVAPTRNAGRPRFPAGAPSQQHPRIVRCRIAIMRNTPAVVENSRRSTLEECRAGDHTGKHTAIMTNAHPPLRWASPARPDDISLVPQAPLREIPNEPARRTPRPGVEDNFRHRLQIRTPSARHTTRTKSSGNPRSWPPHSNTPAMPTSCCMLCSGTLSKPKNTIRGEKPPAGLRTRWRWQRRSTQQFYTTT